MVATVRSGPGTTAPPATIHVPSSSTTCWTRVPGTATVPSGLSTWPVSDSFQRKLNPEIWAKRPVPPGGSPATARDTAFSRISLNCDRGMFSSTVTKFGNGTMSKVSSSVIGPAGMIESLRMPPPFCNATSGAATPNAAASWVACQRSASAIRLPSLVSRERTSLRRPSRSTSLVAITLVAKASRAATTGSTTMSCTMGSGGTASGKSPPATRTGPLSQSSMRITSPLLSKPTTSRPT